MPPTISNLTSQLKKLSPKDKDKEKEKQKEKQKENQNPGHTSTHHGSDNDTDHSADEMMDSLPSLKAPKQQQPHEKTDHSSDYCEDTIEFVDDINSPLLAPSAPKQQQRRRSSLVRKFSVGSLTDSIKIDIGEPLAASTGGLTAGDNESISNSIANSINDAGLAVVYDSHLSDSVLDPKVSDFEPITVLGQGAYGKVLLVRHLESGKLFAQKQLKKASILVAAKTQSSLSTSKGSNNDKRNLQNDLSSDEKSKIDKKIERTMAERDILAKIRHQFIVKLFYALQDASKIYLYLEFVPGGELFHHLNSTNFLDEKTASFYAAEMALALRHLHDVGVVYRDLKPENCLLDSNGHLVLTDFGLSKISTSQGGDGADRCNSIIGTPEYMAPEVLRGEDYSFAVDWWSLGTVIYDMLSGKPPFTGNNHKTISNKILKNKITYPFYFSADAKQLLQKLLNKNPAKRMDVDSEFDKFTKLRFFRHIDWVKLNDETKYVESQAPIVPIITNPVLAENFDEQFTSMKISNYDGVASGEEIKQSQELAINANANANSNGDLFKGFSYTASSSYIEKFL